MIKEKEKITDEWIINEAVEELEEARTMGRKATFFVSSNEQMRRVKQLLPVANFVLGRWNA